MKKSIIFSFIFVFLFSQNAFSAYKSVFNSMTGRGDYVGSIASSDVSIVCAANSILQTTGSGTWSCIQPLTGSTSSGGNLTLQSTSHATKGKILFGTSAYDEVNNTLSVGTTSPLNTTAGDLTASRLFLGNAAAITTNIVAPLQVVGNTAATSQILSARMSDDANPPGFQSAKARGSVGSPSAVLSGDNLFSLAGYGYVSSGVYAQGSTIVSVVDRTPSTTAVASALTFNLNDGDGLMRERLRLSSNGNFGVQTPSATANFQVAQTVTGTGTVSTPGSSTTLTGVGTQFTNTFKVGDTITITGETVRTISTITSNTVLDVTVAFSATPRSAVGYALTGGYRFSVLGNGNVGIGTTSPSYKLDIGNLSDDGFRLDASASNKYIFNILSQAGTNKFAFGVAGGTDQFANGTVAGDSIIRYYSTGKLHFAKAAQSTPTMTLDQSGNVGIGTTSPTSRIHGVTTLSADTGNEIAYQLNYTTNKATSGNDTGLLINMTDTASPGTSVLADFKVGGSSKFIFSPSGQLQVNYGISPTWAGPLILNNLNYSATGYSAIKMGTGTHSETSGINPVVEIAPTYNQASGNASNTDLLINRTQTAVGSGAQLLIDAQVATTSKFKVDNTGGLFLPAIKSGATQAAASAAAGELWKTASHATLPDNVVMVGV